MHLARCSISAAVAFALTGPFAALAQEAGPQTGEPKSTVTQKSSSSTSTPEQELGEVRVQAGAEPDSFRATEANTGALGDRPLLDTPFSINVVTDALIRNQQMATPQDVFRNDPSFAWETCRFRGPRCAASALELAAICTTACLHSSD